MMFPLSSYRHESYRLLCLVSLSELCGWYFRGLFYFHEWFDSFCSASECKHSECDQMKIKSDQRGARPGVGLRTPAPFFLQCSQYLVEYGIPLMQSWVTAIPGSQAGQYPAPCQMYRTGPVSLWVRGSPSAALFASFSSEARANKWVARERHGRSSQSRNNIQRAPSCNAGPVLFSPGPISQLLLPPGPLYWVLTVS